MSESSQSKRSGSSLSPGSSSSHDVSRRRVLGDITNSMSARSLAGSQSERRSPSPPGSFQSDPMQMDPPGQFEPSYDLFDPDCKLPEGRPGKEELDSILGTFQQQIVRLQTDFGSGFLWAPTVFKYSTAEYETFESFLLDLHGRLGHGAMNLILQTFSAIYDKIQYIRQGYYACGQDPSFAHFKVILADLEHISSRVSTLRTMAVANLSLLDPNLSVPPLDDSPAIKDSTKLLDFVKSEATRLGYRFCYGFVFKRVIVTVGSTVHKTPYWQKVKQPEQLRQDTTMETVQFVNMCYKVDRLGTAAANWTTTASAKKDCADALENNIAGLALPSFSRYLFSFMNGTLDILHHKWYPWSEGIPLDSHGGPVRSAAYHPVMFDTGLLSCRGGFDSIGDWGGTWWGDEILAFQPILDHQHVPADARRVFLAMMGCCLFDIGERIPHPDYPTDPSKRMLNRLEVILFIWGRGGTGKSTLLKVIMAIYNGNTDIVGKLENQSSERFGLQKIKNAYVVIAHDIDSNFNLPPTQLTQMTSGEPVTIQVKNNPDYETDAWRAMFAMAGNESFTTREDANVGNRLTRRILGFFFGQKVGESDRSMDDNAQADIGRIIWVVSWGIKALLADLGEGGVQRGIQTIINRVDYLKQTVDDLNSNSRVMRKFLEHHEQQLVYGPDAWVPVEFLKAKFSAWKVQERIRNNEPGTYYEWNATTVDDAFGYAERRLRPPQFSNTPIEPKDATGVLFDPLSRRAKKIYRGIGWVTDAPVMPEEPEQAPADGPLFL